MEAIIFLPRFPLPPFRLSSTPTPPPAPLRSRVFNRHSKVPYLSIISLYTLIRYTIMYLTSLLSCFPVWVSTPFPMCFFACFLISDFQRKIPIKRSYRHSIQSITHIHLYLREKNGNSRNAFCATAGKGVLGTEEREKRQCLLRYRWLSFVGLFWLFIYTF